MTSSDSDIEIQSSKKTGRRKSQLTKEELSQLKSAFKFFDKDGNGTVEPEEIGEVMQVLGLEITNEELADIMADLDENGDGVMDFDEFVVMMDRRMSIRSQRAEIEETFKVFDKNGDGKITFDELKEVLTQLGEEVSDKDVMDMIREADLNGDGAIDFEEFMIMMTADSDSATKSLLLK
jgi:calmodulin